MKKLIAIMTLMMVLVISGCGSSSDSQPREMNESKMDKGQAPAQTWKAEETIAREVEAADEELKVSFTEGTGDSSSGESEKYHDGNTQEAEVAFERKIIKTGFVYMETLDFERTIEDMRQLINKYNAYTSYSESNSGSFYERGYSTRSSRYTIKVPAEMFEEMYEELQTLGHVLNANEGKQDVTSQFVDIEARLTTLYVQEERLLAILEKTENLEDVIELEYALQNTRYEIERFTTNLRNLEDQVRYSTLEVSVQEVYEETVVEKPVITFQDRISEGLKETFEEISDGFQNFIIFIVTQFPYLLVALAFLYGLYRFLKKINGNKALEAASKPVDDKIVDKE